MKGEIYVIFNSVNNKPYINDIIKFNILLNNLKLWKK